MRGGAGGCGATRAREIREAARAAEDDGVDGADAGAGEHDGGELDNHGEVDDHAVALLDAHGAEVVCNLMMREGAVMRGRERRGVSAGAAGWV